MANQVPGPVGRRRRSLRNETPNTGLVERQYGGDGVATNRQRWVIAADGVKTIPVV